MTEYVSSIAETSGAGVPGGTVGSGRHHGRVAADVGDHERGEPASAASSEAASLHDRDRPANLVHHLDGGAGPEQSVVQVTKVVQGEPLDGCLQQRRSSARDQNEEQIVGRQGLGQSDGGMRPRRRSRGRGSGGRPRSVPPIREPPLLRRLPPIPRRSGVRSTGRLRGSFRRLPFRMPATRPVEPVPTRLPRAPRQRAGVNASRTNRVGSTASRAASTAPSRRRVADGSRDLRCPSREAGRTHQGVILLNSSAAARFGGSSRRPGPGVDLGPERVGGLRGEAGVVHRGGGLAGVGQQRLDLALDEALNVLPVVGPVGGPQQQSGPVGGG